MNGSMAPVNVLAGMYSLVELQADSEGGREGLEKQCRTLLGAARGPVVLVQNSQIHEALELRSAR